MGFTRRILWMSVCINFPHYIKFPRKFFPRIFKNKIPQHFSSISIISAQKPSLKGKKNIVHLRLRSPKKRQINKSIHQKLTWFLFNSNTMVWTHSQHQSLWIENLQQNMTRRQYFCTLQNYRIVLEMQAAARSPGPVIGTFLRQSAKLIVCESCK